MKKLLPLFVVLLLGTPALANADTFRAALEVARDHAVMDAANLETELSTMTDRDVQEYLSHSTAPTISSQASNFINGASTKVARAYDVLVVAQGGEAKLDGTNEIVAKERTAAEESKQTDTTKPE